MTIKITDSELRQHFCTPFLFYIHLPFLLYIKRQCFFILRVTLVLKSVKLFAHYLWNYSTSYFTAEPNRDAVFHITFPEEWKAADLANMFSTFGEENTINQSFIIEIVQSYC